MSLAASLLLDKAKQARLTLGLLRFQRIIAFISIFHLLHVLFQNRSVHGHLQGLLDEGRALG